MTGEITQIKLGGENYPKLLAHIADPPKQLYCRGNLELLNSECIGVVGTRKLTPYGKEAAQYLTRGLATAGFTIVSGLAMGIDAIAHQTALDNEGKTIAVLGGGISDKDIGPKVNFALAKNILKNKGLLTSEHPDNSKIVKASFAVRNRIISGLSKGVVIIEADRDSGSLITAKCALDQNRDVFAVPGSIFSQKSTGSNELIKSGAKLVTSVSDIIDEYGYNLNLFNKERNISTKNPVQKNILAILQDVGDLSADEIMSRLSVQTGLSANNTSDILSSLSVLEINGLIKKSINGKYSIPKNE